MSGSTAQRSSSDASVLDPIAKHQATGKVSEHPSITA